MAKAKKTTTKKAAPAPKAEATTETVQSAEAVKTESPEPEKNDLEKVQDFNLPEFEKEVAAIDSIEELEKLKAIEKRDDHRKGAYEAIEKRINFLTPVVDAKHETGEPDTEGTQYPDAGSTGNPETKKFEGASIDLETKEDISEEEQAAIDQANEEAKLDFVEEIKLRRLDLDRLLQFLKAHHRIDASPEADIFLAKAWLGKLLSPFGSDNPYAGESKIEARNEIPAAAETHDGNHFRAECYQFNLKDTYKAVIQLREELAEIIDWIDSINLDFFDLGVESRTAAICRTQAYVHAQQAKFHLGVILGAQKV